MTTSVAGPADDFVSDLTGLLAPGCDSSSIRAVMALASGGQWSAYGPDGRRASTLTSWGIPLEVSVSGGRGQYSPTVRYIAEAATGESLFDVRLAAQLQAVRELVTWLPRGCDTTVDMFRSFVAALYPDPAKVSSRYRSAIGIGIVQHAAAPRHIARLKVYGGLRIVPGALERLGREFPGFVGLAAAAEQDNFLVPHGAALEVDAYGDVQHKIYMRSRVSDIAAPMKLTRYFGEPAWKILSEFARGGFDASQLYRHRFFVCCARASGRNGFAIQLMPRRSEDISVAANDLAARHYGTNYPIQALVDAAQANGANWEFSGIALGFDTDHGVDKLNVYGTPVWNSGRPSGGTTELGLCEVTRGGRKRVDVAPDRATSARSSVFRKEAIKRVDLERAIAAACEFLIGRQDTDGYWRDYQLPSGRSDAWVTGCVGVALEAVQRSAPADFGGTQAVDSAVGALLVSQRPRGWGYNLNVACDADSTSWALRSIAGHVADPAAQSGLLARYRTETGGMRTFTSRYTRVYGSWASEHDEVTAMAGLALLALGDRTGADKLRLRSLARYRKNGSWHSFRWRSHSYAMAQNLMFLNRPGGVPKPVVAMETRRLLQTVRQTEFESGEDSSFDVAQCLIAAVQLDASEHIRPLCRALLASQLDDGSWPAATGLLVPGRWDDSVSVFSCDRRVFITAMVVLALVEVVANGGLIVEPGSAA